jgi:hypothetical protein
MTAPRQRTRLATATLALTLLAAACGADGDDSTTGAATATTTASATTAAGAPTTKAAGHDDHGKAPAGAKEVDDPAPRLLVADAKQPSVKVVDLATGTTVTSLTVPGAARVYTAGRHVFATVGSAKRLEVIDPGTWAQPHGDHFHFYVSEPKLTTLGLAADNPVHVVDHHGLVAVFNDGDGTVLVIDTHKLGESDAIVARLNTGAAHHGVALALEDLGVAIVSTPVAGGPLPNGVAVVDLKTGTERERFQNCPDLHGEAATDTVIAFGCSDGVLLLEPHKGHWHAHKVDRPAGYTGPIRTGTLHAGHDLPFLVGNLGNEALVRIDIESETATAIPLPTRMASFALDPVRKVVLVATIDGKVHRIDPKTGAVLQSVEAIAAFTPATGHGGAPNPALHVAGDRAYLTDPANGQVVELGIVDELRVARKLAVGGNPASITVAGLPDAGH